ncbi:MAG: squalene synthase HpnC [Beijerinckiaceae bacterium]|nr:squalene synthase HpnC [Beijerinckiaceae bacterium]
MSADTQQALEVAASKTETGENFPVASRLIAPRHRATVLAFYKFARAADDIADHPDLPAPEKIARLDLFEATLLGQSDAVAAAMPLRATLAKTGLSARPALDLLIAFRMDATKTRYRDFDELLHYCRYSAAPVGRFVLSVHGEPETTWPANDALCAALQIINHLQDCGKDFREIDRVYIPQDVLARHGAATEWLGGPAAPPPLLAAIHEVAARNLDLIRHGALLSPQVRDWRLCLETAIIARLAAKLNGFLTARDPLSQTVHLSKPGALFQALLGAGAGIAGRFQRAAISPETADHA